MVTVSMTRARAPLRAGMAGGAAVEAINDQLTEAFWACGDVREVTGVADEMGGWYEDPMAAFGEQTGMPTVKTPDRIDELPPCDWRCFTRVCRDSASPSGLMLNRPARCKEIWRSA